MITHLIQETILRIELSEHMKNTTKSTQTDYMPKANSKDRARLIVNANKNAKTLTDEAKDDRIVELNVEVAKRDETIRVLQERVLGLRKVVEFMEGKMIETDNDPKESNYLTVCVDQYQLIDVKRNQNEIAKVARESCDKINTLIDYLKAFKGISLEPQEASRDEAAEETTSGEAKDTQKEQKKSENDLQKSAETANKDTND